MKVNKYCYIMYHRRHNHYIRAYLPKSMDKQQLIQHLKEKGFDESLLTAFQAVDREKFVPEHLRMYAYEDTALPTQHGHILAAPSTIAFMLRLLEPMQARTILEIGSGSGYVLALLQQLAPHAEIYGVEIIPELATQSRTILTSPAIHIFPQSGLHGLPEHAPFDRILISAAADDKQTLLNLIPQLTPTGILVGPAGNALLQVRMLPLPQEPLLTTFPGFQFVPLQKEE